MPYRLYLRPGTDDHASDAESCRYDWLLQDASGHSQDSGQQQTRQAIERSLSEKGLDSMVLVGLIPAEEALFCIADIPARQNRLVRQAVPYAIEDQLSQDVESLHFALGSRTSQGYPVAVIDRERMAYWLSLFEGWQHGRLEAVYPDASLLPLTTGGWTVCLDGEVTLMLNERGEWVAVNADTLPAFAHTMSITSTETVETSIPIRIHTPMKTTRASQEIARAFREVDDRFLVETQTLEHSVLHFLAWSDYQHLSDPINLCQGVFSPASNNQLLNSWRPLVAVCGLWFILQVGLNLGMGVYHQKQADRLEQRAMAIYHQVFPNDTRTHPGNVRRVVQGQLRVAGAGASGMDFLKLLSYTADQYQQLPGAQPVTVNAINFNRNQGQLVVDMHANSYDPLSRLRDSLAEVGLQADIDSVVNEPAGTRGRLTVSGD
ncbi:type II secretion system protein GspL [Marinobacter oulmenensis]|uniref:Type II secretion system protein L n=1 Tax=Marinobacter oulmenensis TaxID=643747 RepID=A0A840UI50_9GAMM|nr:type II secretion system protein GspL [Marinobacter oulmenensis]MBB5320497.1 general secretion pathway protein L [Marinobacter oulmenensis]